MATTTIIQVPVEKRLRDKAQRVAVSQGFSSLQDVMRLFLQQFIDKKIAVSFTEPPVKLSKRNAARYDKMTKDFEEGRVTSKQFTSVKDFMDDLNA
jgi:antitoxin component of RelBE/YafQ-DinJ toxin-antitoxin module